jgi:hypothetical protein
VLPKADLGVLYGASGAGKSFVALDLALAITRGEPWRGRKVNQGRVLYIAAEGGGGVAMRLKAYAEHHTLSVSDLPLGIMHSVPNFLLEEDVGNVAAAITAARGVDLVIVDTFAQVTPGGNENSGEHMGMALRHARAIKDETGAMVLLVHHSGKDASKGARGWSGIRAAADVELEVIRPEEGVTRILRTSKQKDGQDDLAWGFKLESVMVGLDEEGDAVSSLVVIEADMPAPEQPKERPRRNLTVWEQVVMDALMGVDMSQTNVTVDQLINLAAKSVPAPENGERDMRTLNASRSVVSLARGKDRFIEVEHGNVYIVQYA